MTKQIARVGLALGILMAGRSAAAEQVDLFIKLIPGIKNGRAQHVGAKCMAELRGGDKSREVAPGDTIIWHVDGSACGTDYNRNSIKLDFDTNVLSALSASCVMVDASHCDFTGTIMPSGSENVPNLSRHAYVIKYKGRNAGDPELDINDGSGAPPPPGTAPLPAGRGRGASGR